MFRTMSVIAAAAGLLAGLALTAVPTSGQAPAPAPDPERRLYALRAGGVEIGASVRDLEGSEAKDASGVRVESVRPEGPAARAGLQAGDIITRFDGEPVRGARQFGRLVDETPAGKAVAATVQRDGRPLELTLTPQERPLRRAGFEARGYVDERRLQERLEEARERIGRIPFDLDLDLDLVLPRAFGRSRLGVSVQELTPQLASFFGVKDGVLVTSVAEDTPASRAGLRAGDVIVSVNGQVVGRSSDLVRVLRDAGPDADVTIGIVRDKQESAVKARLDGAVERRPARPIRPVRAMPASAQAEAILDAVSAGAESVPEEPATTPVSWAASRAAMA